MRTFEVTMSIIVTSTIDEESFPDEGDSLKAAQEQALEQVKNFVQNNAAFGLVASFEDISVEDADCTFDDTENDPDV